MGRLHGVGLMAAAAFVLPTATTAQEQPYWAPASEWTYTVAPYVWAAGLEGKVATLPGLPEAEVDLSFGDILEDLNFAGMIAFNANNGRWGVSADFQYVQTESTSKSLRPLFDKVTVTSTSTILTLTGEYLLTQSPGTQLWGAAGMRYWSVDTDLDLSGGVLPGRSIGDSDHWVDPVIGLRGRADLSDAVFFSGWAYYGGFGVGSEYMGDVFGGVGYQFTPTTAGVLGYRWLTVNREDGDFLYDVRQSGIMTGLTFTF